MKTRMAVERLSHVAAVGTWAVVSGIALYDAYYRSPHYDAVLLPAAVIAALYLLAMLLVMRCDLDRPTPGLFALGAQLLLAYAFGVLMPFDYVQIYTIIWIAMAVSFFSARTIWFLLVGVIVAWYLVQRFVWGDQAVFFSIVLFATFHLFAMMSSRTARDAEVARDRAEALNRELVATQHLLSEASRQSERLRIARDLHDLLGHHLTALSINLQVAERLADGEVRGKVEQSRAIARLLLADVRDAVSTLREEGSLDFRRALSLLVESVPNLNIHLDIEEGTEIDDVEVAESLLRCVQEAVTNTLRHAGAGSAWIRIWREAGRIRLQIYDDGQISGQVIEGNGLTGMRERLERLKGSLELDTQGSGLRLNVAIPAGG